MKLIVEKWPSILDGCSSVDQFRPLLNSDDRVLRFNQMTLKRGEQFGGSGVASNWYVVSGALLATAGEVTRLAKGGELLVFPSGSFFIKVLEDSIAVYVVPVP